MNAITPKNKNYLTACVICRDTRASLWAKVLLSRFAEVYVIASNRDCRKFVASDNDGVITSRKKLPSLFNAVFYHSSDEILWRSSNISSNYIFEFNTPGTSVAKEGIIPILRQTAPNFAIQLKDVEEIANYLTGQRTSLPSICCPPLEILPALYLLCQAYMAVYPQQEQVRYSSWWQKALFVSNNNDKQYISLKELLDSEWNIAGASSASKIPVQKLSAMAR